MPSTVRSSSSTSRSSLTSSSYNNKQDSYPVLDEQFLPRIVAVFYSIFHPTEGAKVVYQVPEGIISTSTQPDQQQAESSTPSSSSSSSSPTNIDENGIPVNANHQNPIFDFKSVSEFIIPKAPLCGRLISYSIASSNGQTYKILSLPIILLDQAKYPRKSFIFNVAFVFDGRADTRAYEPIVRKCARELKDLELSSSFLSRSQFRMYWVIEQLFEDLNSYCESFVALPDAPHTKYVDELGKERVEKGRQGPLIKQTSRRPSPSHTNTSKNIKIPLIGSESLRDTLEQSQSIPPLSIGDPSMPTESSYSGSQRSSVGDLSLASPLQSGRVNSKDSPQPFSSGLRTSSSSLIGSPGLRPGLGSSKTLAALVVNETTVSALQGKASSDAAAGKETPGEQFLPRRLSHTDEQVGQNQSNSVDMERGLSESIMSLRNVEAQTEQRTSEAVGAVPPAAMLAPGKREPPHGLGRTVRDAINLKLFPTYSNPKDINDWDVPVTLLDLRKRVTGNWDLTMCKVLPFIDGINHVKRIAQLADADLELTRQCIEHLLYYRCIITTDTFQFTNMYTVRPSIAVMAEDEVIVVECALYVTKPGHSFPTWPKLLSLYSSLRPALTVEDWMEENDVDALGIDVRRFVSFGVIKGFLRRVHRYPVLLQGGSSSTLEGDDRREQSTSRSRERGQEGEGSRVSQLQVPLSPESSADYGAAPRRSRLRQVSENDSSVEAGGSIVSVGTSAGRKRLSESHRKTRATVMDVANVALEAAAFAKDQDRRSKQSSTSSKVSIRTPLPRGGSSSTIRPVTNDSAASNKNSEDFASMAGTRGSRGEIVQIPSGFVELLDGTHPDDELCVRFGKSWTEILKILVKVGKEYSPATRQAGGRRGTYTGDLEEEGESGIKASTSGWANMGLARGDATADESGIAGMSSFYSSSNRRRSLTASLPRYRSQQNNQSGPGGQSGFSRYASTGGGGGGVGNGVNAWGRLSGMQSDSLGVEDVSQINRESIARGDLGQVKIIIK